MTARSSRLAPLAALLLALPVMMGPGRCGFILDFTETRLITEPVERVHLAVDDGTVQIAVYDRDAVLLKRHTFAFEPSLSVLEDSVDDGVLNLEGRCKYEGNCQFDHMLELPLGISLDLTLDEAEIAVTSATADIHACFTAGWFRGYRLAAPVVAIDADDGDIGLEFTAPPAHLRLTVATGVIHLAVPPGPYRCELTAPDGAIDIQGITCDDHADALLELDIDDGTITIVAAEAVP